MHLLIRLNIDILYGAIALSYPSRVRVRAMVKLSAVFFHDESSITIGGYESAIVPYILHIFTIFTIQYLSV